MVYSTGMKQVIPIKVECHSGYKADEYPKCFHWNNDRYEIVEILDRWYQGELDPEQPVSNYFKVDTDRDGPFIIKHVIAADEWYLYL
jgi:hypothetical protein